MHATVCKTDSSLKNKLAEEVQISVAMHNCAQMRRCGADLWQAIAFTSVVDDLTAFEHTVCSKQNLSGRAT